MTVLARALAAFLLLAASQISAAAQNKTYVNEALASEAVRLEQTLRGEVAGVPRPAALLRREGDSAFDRGDARGAARAYAAAVVAEPKDAATWIKLARAALAVDYKDYRERTFYRPRAAAAAYIAYQRAATRAQEAEALSVLGEAYAARELWRPALNAYKASLERVDDADVRATYEELRNEHGFRILDYKVDSDAASPRLCFEFSEPLARGRNDFSPFITITNITGPAIGAEDRQLCIDGLKHGERYSVVVRQGLPSSVGEVLTKSSDYTIYVRDRRPQVRFTGRNYVLPRTGQDGIPLVSVNTSKADIEIYRIGDRSLMPTIRAEEFLSQYSSYSIEELGEKATKIWTGTLDVRLEQNRDVITTFPVLEAVGKLDPGIYVMLARPEAGTQSPDESTDYVATQWFVVSDLGLTALSGEDGVHVLVRSLAGAEPVVGVEVRLIAKNNEVLGTKATDGAGHVRFDPGLSRGSGGLVPGLVVVTTEKGDYGFLDLTRSAFDLTDRGVSGRPAPGALDAFLFTERGVYRSGETVHVTALLRDSRGRAVAGAPLTLVVERPDGVEYRRAAVEDQGAGGRAFSLPLLSNAASGTWRVKAFTDPKRPSIGEVTFLVEDYVPERIELELKPAKERLKPGEAAEIAVDARYLYGAPGADLDIAGEIAIAKAPGATVPGLDGYQVGLDDEAFEPVTQEIEEAGRTDGQGRATVSVDLPDVAAPHPLQAKIVLRVAEPGGRAVERSVELPILPGGPVIGVKKLFSDAGLSAGATANFEVVVADPSGRRLDRRALSWELLKVDKRYQWFASEGRWDFEVVNSTRRVTDGRLDATATEPARLAVPVDWGSYRLDIRAGEPGGPQTSVAFEVGVGAEATADSPDRLDVALDRREAKPGEELQLRIAPRFAGKATILVIGDRLLDLRTIDVTPDGATVPIRVGSDWGAGAYAVVLAHRPLDEAARRQPGRALGLAWFGIDREAHTISVALDAPKLMRPRSTLSVPVRLSGLAPGEEARIVAAAVDVGILNLTRYRTPNPDEFYFGQRQLSAEIRDLYGFLIDGMQGARGAIRAGGDIAATLEGSPPKNEPLARYSGVVQVGPDGVATISFDIPAFNGTIRFMAVAWSADKVGHAETDILVRDPVVVAATLPRVLALGDQSRFHIEIDNVEGPPADYTVDVDIHGPIVVPAGALRHQMRLSSGQRQSLAIPVTGAGAGTAQVDLRVTGPGIDAGQSLVLPVRPANPAIYKRSVQTLAANGGTLQLTADVLADFIPGTGTVSVAVSPIGGIDVPALLKQLDRFPYGCSEQIVSRALPLLYVNRLARAENLAIDGDVDERIRDAIQRVLARQDSTGSFGLWGVGGDDLWLDAYVTDFLTRAREQAYLVPQKAFELALDRLRNVAVNLDAEDAKASEGLAYASYVLARNGRPVLGDLRYLADTKLDKFDTPLARGQIAAALALLGDRPRAAVAFRGAVQALAGPAPGKPAARLDYGSVLRDGAGLLTLVGETGVAREELARASAAVERAREATRFTSTQEQAWLVLAAQALAGTADRISLTIDGEARAGPFYRTFSAAALDGRAVAIANTGSAPVRLVVTTSGHPVAFDKPASEGYGIERTYYKLDGAKIDPSRVKQNDRFVVVLRLTEKEARDARVLVVDMLPAGFEIENPNLVDGGKVEALAWLKREVEPAMIAARDDRFVAAFERRGDQPAFFTVAYVVRAVATGRYIHPPATIEDMYRPDRYARTGYGTVEITSAGRP